MSTPRDLHHRGFIFVVGLLVSAAASEGALAGNLTWVGSNSNFNDPANWSPAQAPTIADTVDLNAIDFGAEFGGQSAAPLADVDRLRIANGGWHFTLNAPWNMVGTGGLDDPAISIGNAVTSHKFLYQVL